jgi:4-hydroxybenzoate polyprenyltransferase
MPNYTEEIIRFAIQDVENGISLRKAAERWAIPRSTLHSRIHGRVTRNEANEHNQRLSPLQELHLVGWILGQGALGLAPTHQQVRELAARVVRAGGDDQPLGKAWMEGFLRRNPEVKTVRGKPIDSCRLNGATTKIVKEFFSLLKIPAIEAISPDNRYNMDETGLLEGRGSNGLVLGAANKKAVMKKQPGSRCWTTILECISATGRVLTPLVIFKGKSVQHQWFPSEIDFLAD